MVENAGNGESVESYYRQYTGAVYGRDTGGGDGGAGCGGRGYGVCGDCAVSEDWGLNAVYCPLFGEDNMLISAAAALLMREPRHSYTTNMKYKTIFKRRRIC